MQSQGDLRRKKKAMLTTETKYYTTGLENEGRIHAPGDAKMECKARHRFSPRTSRGSATL